MAKLLELNTYEAHIVQQALRNLEESESMRDLPGDDPHKNRLITVKQKISFLFPNA